MYKLAFLIPHYNHTQNIKKLIDELRKFKVDILIVDDGSNDSAKETLSELGVRIIYREKNGGKGAAMKTGFEYLSKNGYTHALQIDADMQHSLESIDSFIELSKKHPKALICGNPIYTKAPKSRLYGRKITNFWVIINTLSFSIKDSMCGFRLYPLAETMDILPKCKANRMDYDIDILMLLHRAEVKFFWIDVDVFYDKNNTSHFKMFRDNLLISKTHAKYFFSLPKYLFKRVING